MTRKDNILKEARVLNGEFNKIKSMIYEMCDDLEKEKSFNKKEAIKIAIKKSVDQLEEVKDQHHELLKKL